MALLRKTTQQKKTKQNGDIKVESSIFSVFRVCYRQLRVEIFPGVTLQHLFVVRKLPKLQCWSWVEYFCTRFDWILKLRHADISFSLVKNWNILSLIICYFAISCFKHTPSTLFIKACSYFCNVPNMNKINSLHHVKEHPKISNFLQFESHGSKYFKVRAISDLCDLYGEYKIQGLPSSILISLICIIYS